MHPFAQPIARSSIVGVILLLASAALTGDLHPVSAARYLLPFSGAVITWTGAAGDERWSTPANWEEGVVPGAGDIARFTASSSANSLADPAFAGAIAGLQLDEGYGGTLTLAHALRVTGDLQLVSGTVVGQSEALAIGGKATVRGGVLETPGNTMTVSALDIQASGVVRLGANGKLDLTGDGTPLTGDGLLDVTTNAPNSVEYTGHATSDLTAAGPATTYRDLAGAPVGGTRGKAGTALPFAAATFSETGSLTLTRGEDNLSSAVIDTANGFAYFGTNTGRVVKVRLSDFARVGALTLNPGETYLAPAVIDTVNGYAYFGAGGDYSPSSVVKVRLSDFTRVGALLLAPDEASLTSAVIDMANGYAYFGTSYAVVPGRVIKVRLSDFTRADTLTLNAGEYDLRSAVIDTTNGYAYFGMGTIPGRVVKVRLSDFVRVGALTFNSGEDILGAAVIDTADGYAYFGTSTSTGSVVQVRLSDFTRVGALTLNPGSGGFGSAAIDAANGYAYFGSGCTAPYCSPPNSAAVKIRLSDFTRADVLNLDGAYPTSAVIDATGGYVYFGTYSMPGSVVKVRLSDFTRVGALTLIPGEGPLTSAVIDTDNGFAYFGSGNSLGGVVKVRLSDFTRIGALMLNPGESVLSAVIDTANGYAYFGTSTSPGTVVKVRLSDFTRVGTLTLNPGESAGLAVIDTSNGYAYFGGYRTVVKVRLSDFTRVGALTLNTGENLFGSAVIDSANGFAYFGTLDYPAATVVKVRLSDFTRVGALALNPAEGSFSPYFHAAAIDTTNGYAYFGAAYAPGVCCSLPGSLVKVRLSDFTRVGALTLGSEAFCLNSAVIDPAGGFAYFGSCFNVLKVRLSDFTRAGMLGLSTGYLSSAVIDTGNDYAYFGTTSYPGAIVKVDLADLDLTQSTDKAVANAGDLLTITLSVKNDSPDTATGLMLTDTLPLSVMFVSATPGSATCNLVVGQVICNLATLPAGASTQVTIQIKVIGGERGMIVNTVSVSANEPRLSTPNTAMFTALINPLNRYLPLVQH